MDAQPSTFRSTLYRVLGIACGLATQACFAATVWQLFWYLYGNESAGQARSSHWMLVDGGLALQFAVVHSALLLPQCRSRLAKWIPSELYGTLYCAATCSGLWLIFLFWQSTPTTVWDLHGTAACGVRVAFILAWLGLFSSLSYSGFGYQTGWTQWRYWLRRQPLPRRGLVDHGPYRWLRHPAYLSFLGLIWFTPHMTFDHALLTSIWTGYIFIGSILKDRRLEFYLRDDYRDFASRVPGYPGMPWGPLARWPERVTKAAQSSTCNTPSLAA